MQLRELALLSLPALALLGLVLILVLLYFVRAERRSVTMAGLLFLLSCGMLALAPGLAWIETFAILLMGLSLVFLVCKILFQCLLPLFGFQAPRIHQEIIVSVGAIVFTFEWLRENGWDLTSLVATSAVITAVVAFSLQDTLGNLLGGVAIQLDRSVRVGDWIQVNDWVGKVQEIRWRHTSIETRNWETLVVPNSTLVKNSFLVLGRRRGEPLQWRRWVRFNVDFRYSPAQVIQVVEKSIRSAEILRVASNPAPNCVAMGFADSYIQYAVRYWLTDLAVDDPTDSEVRTHIYFGLKRAGIPLSIPAHALFMTEESDDRSRRKAEAELDRRTSALRQVDLFRKLSEEDLRETARALVPAPFASGDVMTRAGSHAHWLYIMVSGVAEVLVSDPSGSSLKVSELKAGDCFGEIALLSGGGRLATVIARTEALCYRLDRETFLRVMNVNKEINEQITQLIQERSAGLSEAAHTLDLKVREEQLAQQHTALRERIHKFFSGS